jgi:hypothetical protein
MRFTLALAAATVLATQAHALDLDDAVPQHPDAAVFDLLVQVIPDLAMDSDGSLVGGTPPVLRHVSGEEWAGAPPDRLENAAIDIVPFMWGGAGYLALTSNFGDSPDSAARVQLLAVFTDDLGLVDAVDIGLDRNNGLADQPTLRIGPGDEMLIAAGGHFNSEQSYQQTALIVLNGTELQAIDIVGTFSDRACSGEHTQALALEIGDGPGRYWPITATVIDTVTPTGLDCGEDAPPERREREVSVTYNWSASIGGYVADSDAFIRLAEENVERF